MIRLVAWISPECSSISSEHAGKVQKLSIKFLMPSRSTFEGILSVIGHPISCHLTFTPYGLTDGLCGSVVDVTQVVRLATPFSVQESVNRQNGNLAETIGLSDLNYREDLCHFRYRAVKQGGNLEALHWGMGRWKGRNKYAWHFLGSEECLSLDARDQSPIKYRRNLDCSVSIIEGLRRRMTTAGTAIASVDSVSSDVMAQVKSLTVESFSGYSYPNLPTLHTLGARETAYGDQSMMHHTQDLIVI